MVYVRTIMLKALRDSQIWKLTQRQNILSIMLVVSLVVNLVLSIGIGQLIGTERIVLLWPGVDQDVWIGHKKASASYLKEISEYLLLTTLNVTPKSVLSRQDALMKYIHPSGYGEVKSQLNEEAEIIQKKNITKMFTPIMFEVDDQSLTVKVIGELTTWVSKEKISQEKKNYLMRYKMNVGKLQLIEFKENHDEANL